MASDTTANHSSAIISGLNTLESQDGTLISTNDSLTDNETENLGVLVVQSNSDMLTNNSLSRQHKAKFLRNRIKIPIRGPADNATTMSIVAATNDTLLLQNTSVGSTNNTQDSLNASSIFAVLQALEEQGPILISTNTTGNETMAHQSSTLSPTSSTMEHLFPILLADGKASTGNKTIYTNEDRQRKAPKPLATKRGKNRPGGKSNIILIGQTNHTSTTKSTAVKAVKRSAPTVAVPVPGVPLD
jgi:hypothetical protein